MTSAALHGAAMTKSMHDVSDPRNASILINVNGELKPRAEAVVSVFDSGFMLGDGVWEGLRLHDGQARLPRSPPRPAVRGCKGHCDGYRPQSRRADAAALFDARCQQDERRRPCAIDGHARRAFNALPGSARGRVAGDGRDHSRIQGAAGRRARAGPQAVHRPRPARRSGGAGPEDQLAFQAQLHPRLDPGDAGRRGRGADARPARLRRDVQLDPFLHRAEGRGVDLQRQILPRRHHPRPGARSCAGGGNSGDREGLLADRCLRRRRGVRHRHLRRHRARSARSTAGSSPCRGPMVERLQKLYAERVERDVAEQKRP